ncbi:MAG: LuxR C-terminal-related transcriptional regulator [Treponema sp.]|nr:LuxR C-terminal-related transcriptional regulator [Treponema sp.]
MEAVLQDHQKMYTLFHFERPRLNQLFLEAVKCPLIMVCAGAGYGKTSAVLDFVQEYHAATAWIQLSERDNVGSRFWENYAHTMQPLNAAFAKTITNLGFPDTEDKLNQYFTILHNHMAARRRIVVLDDFHLIEDPAVIHFLDRTIHKLASGTSLFLISRSAPGINTADLISRGHMFSVTEEDLLFTPNELAQYFRQQEIFLHSDGLREIMQDTGGWAFSINLIARSYQKAPGYEGYLRSAIKMNIFQLMNTEIWERISGSLQRFLIRLSLIDHLSIDLIALLAKGDDGLIQELERQNAYIRRDSHINAYLIHHLFLEFLTQKQYLLPEKDKRETYETAGDWCNRNGFKIDALSYYEKTRNYKSIVLIFFELPAQVPLDIAQYAAGIFNRAPAEAFDRIDLFAVMHIRVIISLGRWREAHELMEQYEAKYLKLPLDKPFRYRTLGGIYYCWGILRRLMCIIDDRHDFDVYDAKMDEYLTRFPVDPGPLANYPAGPWISMVGSSRKGAPQEHIEALTRAVRHVSHCFNGAMTGADDLARGELKFFQGDISAAEPFIVHALERAGEYKQFEIVHRALFYLLRIACSQGNYAKAEKLLKDMETYLKESEYSNRYFNNDIALAWYYYFIGMPEMIPEWIKEKFVPYGHVSFIENFGNQVKARYCYLTKQYTPLLDYMREQKQRESILYGRVEMLAMESCVHFKSKKKAEAFMTLKEAYEAAQPNSILMPFIEMGKDMRTLSASALKEPGIGIPRPWLVTINRKSASYARRQSHITAEYKQANNLESGVSFSPRQLEILTDLSHGLSRIEIADNRGLSVNTVKMVINMIYSKLGAVNLADLIRIAVEQKIV